MPPSHHCRTWSFLCHFCFHSHSHTRSNPLPYCCRHESLPKLEATNGINQMSSIVSKTHQTQKHGFKHHSLSAIIGRGLTPLFLVCPPDLGSVCKVPAMIGTFDIFRNWILMHAMVMVFFCLPIDVQCIRTRATRCCFLVACRYSMGHPALALGAYDLRPDLFSHGFL